MKITTKYLKSFSNLNLKKSFSDTVVKVDYSDVMSAKSKKIEEIIDKAFGRNSLGLVIVKNVPEIKKIKDVVLDSGLSLINMPESDKADFTEEKIKDFLGWKERDVTWNDKVDKFVGEFSARTNNETVFYPADPKVEEKFLNVWPKNIPNFQKKFIELGKKVGKIQSSMLNHIDSYLTNFIKIDNKNRLKNIVNHNELFGMLVCYKPPKKLISEWINMHRDNGFITGLVHPNYYNIDTNERIDQPCSLQIKDRNGNYHFMNYSHDEIVLQIGELCTLYSAGYISSTPHRVVVTNENFNYLRINFAQFMDPCFSEIIQLPETHTLDQIMQRDVFKDEFKLENFLIGKSYYEYITKINAHNTKY